MSSGTALEPEELENVPLVRMEDVQPDRSTEKVVRAEKIGVENDGTSQSSQDEQFETFVVDDSELQCVVDIGSMVSIKSEDLVCEEETELIVPEVLESIELKNTGDYESQSPPLTPPVQVPETRMELVKSTPPDSWPTLEILPGGVINLADKTDNKSDTHRADMSENCEMYACAKCSQSFKYLFCLVKHVRWHEEEAVKEKTLEQKMTPIEKKMADLQKRGKEMDNILKNHEGPEETKGEPKQKSIMKKTAKEKYICLHSGKRKIVPKPKVKKVPKKSSLKSEPSKVF